MALLAPELAADPERQKALTLVDLLWAKHGTVCPYVRRDEHGCFCTSPLMQNSVDAHGPCDPVSLQFWCLTEDHVQCWLHPKRGLESGS
jgi:hypothetical protein